MASPLTLYHAGLDPWIGVVREDDHLAVGSGYNALDGVQQRATDLSGTGDPGNGLEAGWGDGSLILDSQWYASLAGQAMTGAFAEVDAARGGGPFMYAGHGQFFAWHGTWRDLDRDARIDDSHDRTAGGADEFKWRGGATGESFQMPIWVLPYHTSVGVSSPAQGQHIAAPPNGLVLGATNDRANESPDGQYFDKTALAQAEQGWVTETSTFPIGQTWLDEGTLATTWIVSARAAKVVGDKRGFDLDEPTALVDVDRYASVNSDVEALYMSSTATSYGLQADAYRSADVIVDEVVADVAVIREGSVGPAQALANSLHHPAFAREPNTPLDEYPGATWGGIADARGTGSDFAEYRSAWHLYVDGHHGITVPTPTHVDARPIGFQTGQPNILWLESEVLPSSSPNGNGQYNMMPGLLTTRTHIELWKDLNGDKWLGAECEPNGAGWDAESGECRDPYKGGAVQNPQDYNGAETVDACTLTNGRGGSVSVIPLAPWQGAFVVENVGGPTSSLWEGSIVRGPFNGMETLTIRQALGCEYADTLESRDAVLLPAGGLVSSFLVRMEIALSQRIIDASLGIDLPAGERVVDVDIVHASL